MSYLNWTFHGSTTLAVPLACSRPVLGEGLRPRGLIRFPSGHGCRIADAGPWSKARGTASVVIHEMSS